MKVFISGSKRVKDEALPESVCSYLNDMMADGNEILIGDCWGMDTIVQVYLFASKYKKVKVYASTGLDSVRSNLGHWEEKICHPNVRTPFAFRKEKDFQMAADCDCGLAIWNGNSKGTFINMLCLCAMQKPCKLYLLKEERWINVDSLEDLRGLTGDEGRIGKKDVHQVLTECGFSDEMTEFLVTKDALSPFELVNIICRAPIALDEKSKMLIRLSSKRNLKFDTFVSVEENMKQGKTFNNIKHDIRKLADFKGEKTIWTVLYDKRLSIQEAMDELHSQVGDRDNWYNNKSLVLYDEWYDTDELQLKSASCGVFYDLGEIEKYIENEEYDNETDEGYYRMEAWDSYYTKRELPRYDYYYYRGKICWFKKLIPEKQENGNTYFMPAHREFADGSIDLSFITPYKSGDIVLIDCRPFGPPFYAIILEASDQWDCCFPTIKFQYPGTNEWSLTSLKHRRFYKDIELHTYEPMLSPLYRLKKVKEEELTEVDDCLLEMSKMISENEEKAYEVCKQWIFGI